MPRQLPRNSTIKFGFGHPEARPRCALGDIPLDPRRRWEVLQAILNANNHLHGSKRKTVSFKTRKSRETFLFMFFRDLDGCGYRMDPRSIRTRHVEFMVQKWLDQGLSPSSLQTRLSVLRVFCNWIGKPGMILKPKMISSESGRFVRSYSAKKDRSWTARGVSIGDAIEAADHHDKYFGAQLRMQLAFGLRARESLMIQPHSCEVSPKATGVQAEGESYRYLLVRRGTKGGRVRHIRIDNDEKRTAILHAKSIAHGMDQSLADPTMTLVQAYRHFYYLMRKMGFTARALGVTAHGLRHECAGAEYETLAGAPPPVRNAACADHERDIAARRVVAEHLGHSRLQITNCYLGSSTPRSEQS